MLTRPLRFQFAFVVAAAAFSASVPAQSTTRVNVDSAGQQADADSNFTSALSRDGRIVAFVSNATNLVPGDTNATSDVFVHDRMTGRISRVSVDSNGAEGNLYSQGASLSGDGRFVAFHSLASNLVPNDTNGTLDAFVHDRQTGRTVAVSVNSSGVHGNFTSHYPVISADGRYVSFTSAASNLVQGDTNGTFDAFVHDRQTGQIERVSLSSSGVQGNGKSGDYWGTSISDNGRFVAFESAASNLVPGDSNAVMDIFVHDRRTGLTRRVSVDTAGVQGNNYSRTPAISGDGRFVAFSSLSNNFVPGDTNFVGDIFVHDMQTNQTIRASVSSEGAQGHGHCHGPMLSSDGRYLTFNTTSWNMVHGDTNNTEDAFLRDLITGTTTRVSVNSAGRGGNGPSGARGLSADARLVAFISSANNLVPGDTNGFFDVFVHAGGALGPLLSKAGNCVNGTLVQVLHATPNDWVAFVYGLSGSFVRTAQPCSGLLFDIGNPALYRLILTDSAGGIAIVADLPAAACGVSLQAVDVRTCTLSNVVVL